MPSTTPHSAILDYISNTPLASFDEQVFSELALRLFAFQFEQNKIYQNYCQQAEVQKTMLDHWSQIPAVTTSAFKHVPLACFPVEQATKIFHTSGTTQQRPGKHYFRRLDFYRTAMLRSFHAYCLPDQEKMRMLILAPTTKHFPNSSLGYMLSELRDEFGKSGSGIFFTTQGTNLGCFQKSVEIAIQENEPIFILGTAFALLECMDHFVEQKIQFSLPQGSRILDTGGYKGRTREVPREEFRDMLRHYFGIPKTYLLNEYGMTELSSQFYESQLQNVPLQDDRTEIKFMPPWVRVITVDPDDLQPLPEGETGMLRVYDLANVESVMAIQTEDIGRAWQDRIELVGRASDAELRGCSLLTESIVGE